MILTAQRHHLVPRAPSSGCQSTAEQMAVDLDDTKRPKSVVSVETRHLVITLMPFLVSLARLFFDEMPTKDW